MELFPDVRDDKDLAHLFANMQLNLGGISRFLEKKT
jgi:hypothetical protein